MRVTANRIGLLSLAIAVGIVGCGGTITANGPRTGQGGQDGGTTTVPCSAMAQCECMAAGDRCVARTEACWCPSECNPAIACICGGGRFLGCESKTNVATCNAELAAVQAKCANQPNVQYIADICTLSPTFDAAASPTCIAGCLANLKNTGSCAEIDCSFCPVCDCAAPATPSPLAACLHACASQLPD